MGLSKIERIDVRASPSVKQLLQEAARASHKKVSEFLPNAGIMSDAQWDEFQQALDRPVQAKPHLQKLLSRPGVLG